MKTIKTNTWTVTQVSSRKYEITCSACDDTRTISWAGGGYTIFGNALTVAQSRHSKCSAESR